MNDKYYEGGVEQPGALNYIGQGKDETAVENVEIEKRKSSMKINTKHA